MSATALFADNAFLDPTAFDWLIVMGGPMGVCDTETFPWMDQETQFIAQCIRQRKKVLGICLGAQLIDRAHWKDGLLKLSFFGLNGGLLLMAFGTLLPVGAMQAWISFRDGLWMARSAEFFTTTRVVVQGTLKAIPDLIIIVFGVLPLAWFLVTTYPRLKAKAINDNESVWERLGIEL